MQERIGQASPQEVMYGDVGSPWTLIIDAQQVLYKLDIHISYRYHTYMRCELDDCDTEFEPKRSNQKYCCKHHAWRAAAKRNRPEVCGVCEREDCRQEFVSYDSRKRYCSRSCAAMVNNTLSPKREKRLPKKTRVEKWLDGEWDATTKHGLSATIRNFLLEEAEYMCQDGRSGCNGWSGFNPKSGKSCLTVDHIDGNCYNNTRENLRVMCPNCHSMTPTYGALNKGNGRSFRYSQSPVA